MQRITTFWRSGWIGKIVLSLAGFFGLLMLCCMALVAVALRAPQPKTAIYEPEATVQAVAVVQPTTLVDAQPQKLAVTLTVAPPTAVPTDTPTDTPIPSPTAKPPTTTPEPTFTPTEVPTATPEPPTNTPVPTATPKPVIKPTKVPHPIVAPAISKLNTHGRDVYNCGDFSTYADAYAVYKANLPGDPNRLDRDKDGIPCEDLPGAP